jgi:type III secretion protein C
VRALEARGLATMVSNPSVLTLENQPAVIDFNRTQYLTAGNENATILPITVGTSFQVVPRVITSRGGHQIHLAVDIEDGNFDESNPERIGPDVRRGKVSTQAVMAEKRSLVVGGFHVTNSADKQNKIPLLGDIPLLGKALFSSTERQNNRRERLFILTPRVIGDQSDPSRYLPQGRPERVAGCPQTPGTALGPTSAGDQPQRHHQHPGASGQRGKCPKPSRPHQCRWR